MFGVAVFESYSGFLQCIITMPDGIVSQRDFVQMMGPEDMHLSITTGNTVVFDSFTAEPEVRRRNIMNNNISKLNETGRHFRAEFSVGIQAKRVSAILCASTVSEYRVVDKKTGKTLTASDKRPKYIREYQAQKQTKRPRSPEPTDPFETGQNIHHPVFHMIPLEAGGHGFEQHPQPLMAASESIFDHHPGRPRCDAYTAGHGFGLNKEGLIYKPNIMNFTSSSSPHSPRAVENSEDESGPIPFPFKSSAPLIEHQPIFGDSSPLRSQTSDNVQALVSINDVLESRMYPMSEELQKNARMLLDMHKRCSQNAPNILGNPAP